MPFMNLWFQMQARAIRLLALALALAGLLSMLYAAGLVAWQFAGWFEGRRWPSLPATLLFDHSVPHAQRVARVMPFIPELPVPARGLAAQLLDVIPLFLFPAVLGSLAFSAGCWLAAYQADVLALLRQRRNDRLRRRREYLMEEDRIEPH
jgi:hypothetical protein